MKKFVLHCNRCTVLTGFFNLNFGGRYPWNEIDERNVFCLNQLIFLLQTDLEEISELFKIVRKKEKHLCNKFGLKIKKDN